MLDLKSSKKSWEAELGSTPEGAISVMPADEPEGPEYPYGTQLDLDRRLINDLDLGDMNAGDRVKIVAIGKVMSVRVADADERTQSMTIQIQKMEITPKADADGLMRKTIAREVFED